MPYYKDKDGSIHFLDSKSDEYLLPEGSKPITAAEAEKISEAQRLIDPIDYNALRLRAYQIEADPLFFKYQRGEATKEEWLSKIEDIKSRFPEQ